MGGCCCCSSRRAQLDGSPVYYYCPQALEEREPLSSSNGAPSALSTGLFVDTNLDMSSPDTYRVPPAPMPYNGAPSALSTGLFVDTNLGMSSPDTYRVPPAPMPYDVDLGRPETPQQGTRESGGKKNEAAVQANSQSTGETITGSALEMLGTCEGVKESDCKSQLDVVLPSSKESEVESSKLSEPIVSTKEEEDVCPICLEEYEAENPRIITKCDHHFHLSCILEWMERSDTCPVCDQEMGIGFKPITCPQKKKMVKKAEGLATLKCELQRRRRRKTKRLPTHGQKKQKTHPSMYEDQIGIDHQSMERLRSSERLVSQKNSYLVSCSESTDLGMSAPPISGKEIHKSHVISDSPTSDMVINQFDDHFRKWVPIGPLFQADVPEWTGVASENDIKWLGMQHWPMAVGNHSSLLERESIGKGRQDSCSCRHPGSVECVRFHIAERKMKLKLELGLTYYSWGFHSMGEEASLSWTDDEEKKFKDIVRLNPQSLDKCFWDQACRCFQTRKWKSLISYYFNVFVLRRRSYQNRVTPANIDSDDDESEFGSVSNGFGHEAIKVPGSTSIFCAQNNQCIDLD